MGGLAVLMFGSGAEIDNWRLRTATGVCYVTTGYCGRVTGEGVTSADVVWLVHWRWSLGHAFVRRRYCMAGTVLRRTLEQGATLRGWRVLPPNPPNQSEGSSARAVGLYSAFPRRARRQVGGFSHPDMMRNASKRASSDARSRQFTITRQSRTCPQYSGRAGC